MLRCLSVLMCLVSLLAWPASAMADDTERELELAITYNTHTKERVLSFPDLIRSMDAAGLVTLKPDFRADYIDYRFAKKSASLYGFSLVMIEEEYVTQWIGCCPNRGFSILLKGNGDAARLTDLAAKNYCEIWSDEVARERLDYSGVTPTSGNYTGINCRENTLPPPG